MSPYDALKKFSDVRSNWTAEDVAGYSPFVFNMMMGMTKSNVLMASEVNKAYITNDMSVQFWSGVIPKGRSTYVKWIKNAKDSDEVASVREYYQCSLEEALTYMDILTKENIEYINSQLDKGGIYK